MKKLLLLLAPLALLFAACDASSDNEIESPEDDTIAVESLAITPGQIELEVGQTQQLEAVLRPDGAEGEVSWKILVSATSEEGVVSVDANGLVTALKAGSAEVEARCGEVAGVCRVTVTAKGKPVVPVESIELEAKRLYVKVGEQATIVATVMPEEAREDNPLSFTSRNTGIATVDQSGKVTGVAEGETKIDVQAGGQGVVCNIVVEPAAGVKFSGTTASDITFSTVTLSSTLEAAGVPYVNVSASFYYMETDGNPTAAEIKQGNQRAGCGMVAVPDTVDVSAKVSYLAVNTRYCYVAEITISGETYFGEVKSFTTTDLPEIPELVDMGYGKKWRGWNVGASKPEEPGDYFAWGETSPKENYTWETYKYWHTYNHMDKYVSNSTQGYPGGFADNKEVLDSQDDAATKEGVAWRMPTHQEFIALMDNVVMKWTRYKGVYGIVMTSKVEGFGNAVLFFPAGGYQYGSGSTPSSYGSIGQYWSASVNPNDAVMASALVLKKPVTECWVANASYRYYGYNVRPVAAE